MAETQDLHDRMTRANSWIEAATRMRVEAEHRHAEFLLLYVAFNGLYGRRQYEETRTQACDDLDDFSLR